MEFDVQYYTEKVMAMLDHYAENGKLMNDGIHYTRTGVEANVEAWMRAKEPLFRLLRNHPNWNEEAKAVVFDITENRTCNKDDLRYTCHSIIVLANPNLSTQIINDSTYRDVADVCDYLVRKQDITEIHKVSSELATYVNRHFPDLHAKEGMKTSRLMNKLFCKLGCNTHPDYNKLFAIYADNLNPMQVTRTTVLSCNIIDWLLMSNGNSWSSCHTIIENSGSNYHGCYKGGTLSYAMDDVSLCFYTVDSSYHGTDWCLQPKIVRQVYFWQSPILVQERLYPQCHDDDEDESELVTQYRSVVESVISTCMKTPNLWKKAFCDIEKTDESFMYEDWGHFCNWTYELTSVDDSIDLIMVGGTSYCMECGQPKTEPCEYADSSEALSTLLCNQHTEHISCAHCGACISRSDAVEVDGQLYGECCVHYCQYHGSNEVGEFTYVTGYGDVCNDALEEGDFCQCDECGNYYLVSDMMSWEDTEEMVCSRCHSLRERHKNSVSITGAKIGDLVIGNEHAFRYSLTRPNVVCKIVDVTSDEIKVQLVAGSNTRESFWVDPRCFDLVHINENATV